MKGVAKLVTDPRLKQKLKDTTGIGTEATRANVISALLARGYLVKKGRAIRASDAAFTLIDAVPAAIADPGNDGGVGAGAGHDRGRPDDAGHLHRQAIGLGSPSSCSSTAAQRSLPPAPSCPQCGALMRQRTGKNGAFWSCSRHLDCKGTEPVETATGKPAAPRGVGLRRRADAHVSSATPAADGGANLLHPAGLCARSLLQRCARPAGPSRPAGREGHFSPDRVPPRFPDRGACRDASGLP